MAKPAGTIRGFLLHFVAFAAAAFGLRCSNEDDRPPPYARPPLEDPKSCVDLRTNGKLTESEFRIAGKRANCAADGLECPMEGTSEVVGRCDGGGGSAICKDTIWRFRCDSSTDAGNDGGP